MRISRRPTPRHTSLPRRAPEAHATDDGRRPRDAMIQVGSDGDPSPKDGLHQLFRHYRHVGRIQHAALSQMGNFQHSAGANLRPILRLQHPRALGFSWAANLSWILGLTNSANLKWETLGDQIASTDSIDEIYGF